VRTSNLHNPWIVGNTLVDWLNFIPKRDGKAMDGGDALTQCLKKGPALGGAPKYYRYNAGSGPVYEWDQEARTIMTWAEGPEEEKKGA
jgi:hypothetical protein